MKRNFMNTVRVKVPDSSKFDLTHQHLYSCNFGELIPTAVIECIPGDKFNLRNEQLTRFAPMISPVMNRFWIKTRWFFVPYRILSPTWETFINGTVNGAATMPTCSIVSAEDPAIANNSLSDYLGLVPEKRYDVADGNDFCFLFHAAYFRIWFEWYRDQNMEFPDNSAASVASSWDLVPHVYTPSEPVAAEMLKLRKVNWAHDYFTSVLPEPQAGGDVTIPFGEYEDVDLVRSRGNSNGDHYRRAPWNDEVSVDDATGAFVDGNLTPEGTGQSSQIDIGEFWQAKTSELETPAPTINELRRAFAVQRWLELNARAGRRYIEQIEARFGVKSSDGRLDRPELIGSTTNRIVVSEVLQTAGPNENDESGVVGDMAGHAISFSEGNSFNYFCEEYGCILGITHIVPEASYFQGYHKMFDKKDKFDFLTPEFQHLGEQPVLNKQLYYSGLSVDKEIDNAEFGYLPIYADYRTIPNRISADFRNSLDFWHYARKFATRPALNADFMNYSNDYRIFAVDDPEVQHIYVQILNSIWVSRKLSTFGTPI